jgi:hypothetical protein
MHLPARSSKSKNHSSTIRQHSIRAPLLDPSTSNYSRLDWPLCCLCGCSRLQMIRSLGPSLLKLNNRLSSPIDETFSLPYSRLSYSCNRAFIHSFIYPTIHSLYHPSCGIKSGVCCHISSLSSLPLRRLQPHHLSLESSPSFLCLLQSPSPSTPTSSLPLLPPSSFLFSLWPLP